MIGLVFSPEQFKTLLRMIYVGNTVANGYREKDFLKDYDELEQYVFSRAKDAGFPAATWRHKIAGEEHHHPSLVFEDDPELERLLDDYDAHTAPDYLALRLAERDIEEKYGPRAKDRMPLKDYDDLIANAAEEYDMEFSQNGFDRLRLEKREEGNSAH